jgi:hypothetical protein
MKFNTVLISLFTIRISACASYVDEISSLSTPRAIPSATLLFPFSTCSGKRTVHYRGRASCA